MLLCWFAGWTWTCMRLSHSIHLERICVASRSVILRFFLALHPYEPHDWVRGLVLMEWQQWFEDHHPAWPGTSGSKVGCVSMVSVGEPWGRAHASAEEVGGRIPSVGAQAPKRL